jgi:hypothetical protein
MSRLSRTQIDPLVDPPSSKREPAARGIRWASLGREFVVTFVGVLLALAVNSWWQERQDRRAEVETLVEIRADLRTDSTDVTGNLGGLQYAKARLDSLSTHLDHRRPYDPSLDSMAAVLGWWIDHQRNAAGYATLKSRGLRLVTNDSLRQAIARFYETTYGEEEQHDRVMTAAFDRTQARVHQYLRQPDYYGPAHPIDYALVASDPGFRALVDEASDRMSTAIHFENIVAKDVRVLSAAIDRELARRR